MSPPLLLCVLAAFCQALNITLDSAPIVFEDVSGDAGLRFLHHSGGRGRRHLPETMGAGGAWLDYDVDGDQDIYLVDSGALPGDKPGAPVDGRLPGANVLFRNDGRGRFDPVHGVAADRGYGRGASVADYDNDGFPDLFMANWGGNALYRNNGDGTFTEVTVEAGLGDPRLSASSSWADLDGDGWLDLYVVTYVAYDFETAPSCRDLERNLYDFCHPGVFDGQRDILYQNQADGTFRDRSDALQGLVPADGKGLAVAIGDLDGDHRPDIYVANDTTPNFVHFNQGGFSFMEAGILSGLGVGHSGQAQASMGIAIGDIDGDLMTDMAVTNFENEPYNLYRPLEPGFYVEDSFVVGFAQPTTRHLGYGIVMIDLDLDGDLDLALANGHTQKLSPVYRQRNQVFTNSLIEQRLTAMASGDLTPPGPVLVPGGWRPRELLLQETTEAAGESFTTPQVSRGMAEGDYDGDGRLDLLVTDVEAEAMLLRNVTDTDGAVLVLRLRGRDGNRDAIGATVWVTPCKGPVDCAASPTSGVIGFLQVRELQGASSYFIQRAPDLHFGLGEAAGAEVRVRWRDGTEQDLGYLEGGQRAVIVQGRPATVNSTIEVSW